MMLVDDRARAGGSALFELTVRRLQKEAEGVVSLELGFADGRALPAWEPGAHVDIMLPNGLVRQYSLCGDPASKDSWRIAVLREPISRGGSQYLHDVVRTGQTLQIAGPRNNFRLGDAGRYLFLAGGIGITPILPMIRAAAAGGRPWTLVYGGRQRSSMAFLEQIQEVSGGDIHICPQDECGLMDLERFLGDPYGDTGIYCCGPGPLIDAVETLCAFWPRGCLHRERFAPTEARQALDTGAFEVELARSGRRLVVPPHRSLLETLEDAGFQITNSCRAGICGTCLLNVVDGVPDHRDDVLTDEERESGRVILGCVSRSKTDRLVLDL